MRKNVFLKKDLAHMAKFKRQVRLKTAALRHYFTFLLGKLTEACGETWTDVRLKYDFIYTFLQKYLGMNKCSCTWMRVRKAKRQKRCASTACTETIAATANCTFP